MSFRWRLIGSFTVAFTAVFVGAFYWFYLASTERALERTRLELRHTIEGAAAGLDGASLTRLAGEGTVDAAGFSDHGDYLAQMAWFETVQSLEPRAWPVTYVPGPGPGQVTALADLWSRTDPAKAYAFREIEPDAGPELAGMTELTFYLPRDRRCRDARQSAEGQSQGTVLGALRGWAAGVACTLARRVGYTDVHGTWVSAYAPVYDAGGVVAGGLAIDFEASYVDEVQDAIIATTSRAFLVTYLTLLLLVLLVSRGVTRPIARLSVYAERVGEGVYDQDFAGLDRPGPRDEIATLAEVLQRMTAKVREREQALVRQVQALRIEIDERKRSEEVQAIVDTDFFRDLQAKARRMRARGEPPVEPSG